MVDIENRLIRYFLPPILMFGSLFVGIELKAVALPFDPFGPVQISAFIIGTGFILSIVTTCITYLTYWLFGNDWEAIIPINDKINRAIAMTVFGPLKINDSGTKEEQFYGFLVYHHVFLFKEAPELYKWSLRNNNNCIIALNSMVGLISMIIGIFVLSFCSINISLNVCRFTIYWIVGNALLIVFLACYAYIMRKRRRNFFKFLAEMRIG